MTNENIFALFQSRFPADRSAPFIETPDGGVFSYADLEAASDRLAQRLTAAGAAPGDRILVQAEKSPQAVFLYLACLKAGLVYLPLNPAYRRAEVAYFVADAEPAVIIADPANEAALSGLAPENVPVLTLDRDGKGSLNDEAGGGSGPFPVAQARADDTAMILYTSGTTGRPKGAALSHGNLTANALALHDIWGFGPGDVLLHALPVFHAHGLFVSMHCVLLNGTGMVFLPKFDAAQVLEWLPRSTVFMGVPTYYARLLAEPGLTPAACASMRLFISGSAPLSENAHRAFHERTGQTILERYGMTEAGMITSNPLDGERLAGSVGFPLPGVSVRVVDGDGKELPAGVVGSLEARGPNVFSGYWRRPELNASEFRPDGYFVTSDLARVDGEGRVTIAGRARDLIISGGLNVYPKEVEAAIEALEGVAECAVVGLPDDDLGEIVAAAVRLGNGADRPDADEITGQLADTLARFKRPRRIVFVAELPRNAMGKVLKDTVRRDLL